MIDNTSDSRTPLSTPDSRERLARPSLQDHRARASAIPFFRKRWFVVVSAFVFIPVTLVILATGPVHQGNGEVWDAKTRAIWAVVLIALMATTFLRFSQGS